MVHMTSTQIKQHKNISLLKKQAGYARIVAEVAQAKLEIAQGRYKTFASADAAMKYIREKIKK